MARKKIQFDLKKIEELAGKGLSDVEIALSLGVNRATIALRKKDNEQFQQAYERGRNKLREDISNALVQCALSKSPGAVSAAMWIEKTRFGVKETNRTELTGPDGAPIQAEAVIKVVELPENGRNAKAS